MIETTRKEFANALQDFQTVSNFENVCDSYYTQFLNQNIVNEACKVAKEDILNDAYRIYTQASVHKIALDLLATKINRLVDRKLVKQASDVASLEFLVNVAKSAIVYIAQEKGYYEPFGEKA